MCPNHIFALNLTNSTFINSIVGIESRSSVVTKINLKGMSDMKIAFSILCILVICTLAFASPKVLFEDNFTGDLTEWRMSSPGWEIDNDTLTFPVVGFSDIFFGEEDWDNYNIEVDVTPIAYGKWGSVRLFFRMNELFTGYGVSFHEGGYVVHSFLGRYDDYIVLVESKDYIIKPGQKVHLRLEVKANKFALYADNKLLAKFEDPEDTYFEGSIGFRADNSAVIIEHVKVTSGN
mgnify:FL=1